MSTSRPQLPKTHDAELAELHSFSPAIRRARARNWADFLTFLEQKQLQQSNFTYAFLGRVKRYLLCTDKVTQPHAITSEDFNYLAHEYPQDVRGVALQDIQAFWLQTTMDTSYQMRMVLAVDTNDRAWFEELRAEYNALCAERQQLATYADIYWTDTEAE